MEYKNNNKVIYSCKYDVVWCPKYRKSVLGDKVAQDLKRILYGVAAERERIAWEAWTPVGNWRQYCSQHRRCVPALMLTWRELRKDCRCFRQNPLPLGMGRFRNYKRVTYDLSDIVLTRSFSILIESINNYEWKG